MNQTNQIDPSRRAHLALCPTDQSPSSLRCLSGLSYLFRLSCSSHQMNKSDMRDERDGPNGAGLAVSHCAHPTRGVRDHALHEHRSTPSLPSHAPFSVPPPCGFLSPSLEWATLRGPHALRAPSLPSLPRAMRRDVQCGLMPRCTDHSLTS